MTDVLDDMGFDDVIAGNVYKPPDEPQITVHEYTGSAEHTCVGAGTRCDICFAPLTVTVSEPAPPVPAPLPPAGLTDEGVQAAKALVHLPKNLDPVALAKLAREIAMDIKERHVVLQEHGLSQVQYDFLEANNPFFKATLNAACAEWHAPLATDERIKVEAAAILEDSLPGLGARMQNKVEGLPGVIEAAKLFAKIAGVGERAVGTANAGERFTINIDLGGDQKITVSTAALKDDAAERNHAEQIPDFGQAEEGHLAIRQEPEGQGERGALPPLAKG